MVRIKTDKKTLTVACKSKVEMRLVLARFEVGCKVESELAKLSLMNEVTCDPCLAEQKEKKSLPRCVVCIDKLGGGISESYVDKLVIK